MNGFLINDLKGVFYPVISFVISKFWYKSSEKFKQTRSFTKLSLVSNYYNLKTLIWEPFIEKLRLEYQEDSNLDATLMINKELNINITTELLSNLTKTLSSV